jgi:hypothetical protein
MMPLTFVELKELWLSKLSGTSSDQIKIDFRIDSHYYLECIAAANYIWGERPKLRKVVHIGQTGEWIKKTEEKWRNYDPSKPFQPPIPREIQHHTFATPKPPEKFIRPKAEYTNTTPYGIAKTINN